MGERVRKTEATGERRLAEEGGTREREDEERERTREKSGARWRRRTERGNCGVTRRKRG